MGPLVIKERFKETGICDGGNTELGPGMGCGEGPHLWVLSERLAHCSRVPVLELRSTRW